jgi:cytidylate kinase
MTEKILIPSIEKRLGALLEFNRRKELEADSKSSARKSELTITISREFGCDAYPMVEQLKKLLEKKSSQEWVIVDKGLLEEVARNHNLSEDVLRRIGEKNLFLDELLAMLSPHWKSDKEYFQLLCQHIVALADAGNVILLGRASAFITRSMKNCRHFRLYASAGLKNRSISRRLDISEGEAETLIQREQRVRDRFIRDFLDRDSHDLSIYNLAFNCDLNSAEKIARTIADYVLNP